MVRRTVAISVSATGWMRGMTGRTREKNDMLNIAATGKRIYAYENAEASADYLVR